MVSISSSIEIERSAADVFAFVTDLEKVRLWQAGLLGISGVKGMPAASMGEIVTLAMGQRLRMRYEVLENDGHGYTRARSRQGPLQFETRQRVVQLGPHRSRFTVQTEIDAGHIFRLAESALESIAVARMEADMAALKILLEARM